MQFADEYLRLEGFREFVDTVSSPNGFVQEMIPFHQSDMKSVLNYINIFGDKIIHIY